MNRRRLQFGMNIGTSSILLVFIILSLVCFAALSLSSAVADQKLTNKALEKTAAYTSAQNLAQQKLAEIDESLYQKFWSSATEEEYFEDLPTDYIFRVDISESQYLEIVVEPSYPIEPTDGFYRIMSWKEYTNINDTEYESTLNVIP